MSFRGMISVCPAQRGLMPKPLTKAECELRGSLVILEWIRVRKPEPFSLEMPHEGDLS